MSLVKIAIDEINHIVHSANPIFSDGTAANRITEFRERIQDVIQGSQYLLPETLHPLLVDFLLAARQLSASLKNDPQEEIPYEQLQASRRQHLEALKATHIRIDEHIREIYSPVLENLRYELPGG